MWDPSRLLISCAAVAVCLLWPIWHRAWHSLRQWRHLKHLPGPPPTHWLLGQVPDFLATDSPMRLARWAAEYGGVYRIRFLYAYGIIVTDPALVRAVLQSSKTYVPKDRLLMLPIELPCGPVPNILTSSDGDYWRLVRGAWMKCFTSTNLKRVLPILQDICERVTQQIKQQAAATAAAAAARTDTAPAAAPVAAPPVGAGAAVKAAAAAGEAEATAAAAGSATAAAVTAADAVASSAAVPAGAALVNICNVMDRITLDVIGHMSYGRDFGAVDHKRSRYLELVSAMLALMHEEMDHPYRKMLRKIRGEGRSKALLCAEWDATNTAEVMRALADPPGEHTIAGQLLAVRDPATQQPLSLQQLKSELVIATLAGFETTSNALSWTLGSLAAHPPALAALEGELQAAGLLAGPQNPEPPRFEWQVLGKLSFLQACIREGLRLFAPAANGTFRMCTAADIAISKDILVPKGTPVGIPLFAFGHNPATYGPDAEAFRPERWLAGSRTFSSINGSINGSMDDAGSDAKATASTDSSPAATAAATAASGSAAAGAAGVGGVQRGSGSSYKQLQDPWTFSIGPRDCAGQALARLELQVVIAAIIGNFRVQLAPEVGGWQGLLQRRLYHTTLQVEGGLPLLLTPRVGAGAADS